MIYSHVRNRGPLGVQSPFDSVELARQGRRILFASNVMKVPDLGDERR